MEQYVKCAFVDRSLHVVWHGFEISRVLAFADEPAGQLDPLRLLAMTRVLSGIKPTSRATLGNYVGALRNWAEDQHKGESMFFLADLHALTIEVDPSELRG